MENTRPRKKMKLPKMIQAEMVKTPAPDKFIGWFSDEFEEHAFWKSKKRFSLHGNKTMRQFIVYMAFGCFFWGSIVGITNYYSFLESQIQPTYLTNICQLGFKKCIKTNEMDYCAHLLHGCIGTGNFTQPDAASLPNRVTQPALTFTDRENEINQVRCKKKKFYAMVF
ncbi:Oidioi.mRNA.OKI2018_I69.chr1.g1423.t1.cds [Oikopleura dioica]|uniref:Oidioi.mRNA.OKI2018_I69.chr1.g1423.t1.cds n=1 Tax=Oikopleura dioica TaxID=34765 RepID=A0ABN7SND9_OIKDI|nr:Oidioi.mRNA.OKI2018_I69.chr1.g1423.t1.cds [Oikopleura dioica]